MKQRLLVSVRGPSEALAALRGGAQIADVEYPASALGTPYPLNIAATVAAIRRARIRAVQVSTNIGETQHMRANACQAALGVATAGAHLIKFGLAELPLEAAIYQGQTVIRTVRRWYPRRKLYPAVFVDDSMQRFFKPLSDSPKLAKAIRADGVLIDTFDKGIGKGLRHYCTVNELRAWCTRMHDMGKEAWLAGSIGIDDLPELWAAGADVICVRGAACRTDKSKGRFGEVDTGIVRRLVATLPRPGR
jgi:(5-formylfuran-3-yl)methyl phosphate synthase